jgi:hypothetical protein
MTINKNYIGKKQVAQLIQAGCELEPNTQYLNYKDLRIELNLTQFNCLVKYKEAYEKNPKKAKYEIKNRSFFDSKVNLLQRVTFSFSRKQAIELVESGVWKYDDEKRERINNGKLSYGITD